jgi:hypothetical protein
LPVDIGGAGYIGVAFETIYNTYVAPTVFIPIRSESLQKIEDKNYRMNIRGIADRTKGPQGPTRIEGDIEFEVDRGNLLYFLYGGRFTPVKVGASAPFTYTFTAAHVAIPTTAAGAGTRKSLSVTVVRSGKPFGYTGLNLGQLGISFDNEMMIATCSMVGRGEAQQSLPTATWPTNESYGPEDCEVKLPSGGSVRTDLSTVGLTINDNLTAESRLDGSRQPSFTKWGEREVTFNVEHDFDTLTDYNAFLNQTIQAIELKGSKSATDDEILFAIAASVADSYQVNLTNIGDLVSAATAFHGIYEAAVPIVITQKTTVDIV